MIKKIENFLFEESIYKILFICLILQVFINGIAYIESSNFLFIASNDIFTNPFSEEKNLQWILSSYFGVLLANFLKIQTFSGFILMHFFFLIFGLAIVIKSLSKKNEFLSRIFLILFFSMPISNILFTWLGFQDPFTFIFATLLVIFRSIWFSNFVLATLLSIAHSEQAIIIIVLVNLFLIITEKKANYTFLFSSVIGLCLGIFLLQYHFEINNFNIEYTRFDYIGDSGPIRYLTSTFSHFNALLFSLFNVSSYIIYKLLKNNWYNSRGVAFIICCLIAFSVTLITIDQTRVFNLLIFPIVILFLEYNLKSLQSMSKKIFTIIFILSIFVPRYYIWEGKIFSSSHPKNIELLKNYIKNNSELYEKFK